MKKFISLMLSLVMLLGLAQAVLAEEDATENMHVFEGTNAYLIYPEGLTLTDTSAEGTYAAALMYEDRTDISYIYTFQYMEDFAGLNIEDLDEEQQTALVAEVTGGDENVQYEELAMGGLSLIHFYEETEEGTMSAYVTVLDGYMLGVLTIVGAGVEMTEDDLTVAAEILTGAGFDLDELTAE